MMGSAKAGAPVLVTAPRIYRTAFDTDPAQAMAIQDGRIGWIGAVADAPSVDAHVDLDGATVLPGLTDAHLHLLAVAQARLQVSAAAPDITRMDVFLRRLADAAQEMAPGAWVIGTDVNEQFWPECRLPDRFDLDRFIPDRPAAVRRFCGHVVCLNSAALQALATRIDPYTIGMDEDERGITGIAREHAAEAVFLHLPRPADGLIAKSLRALVNELASYGLTALNEAAVGFSFGFSAEWALWQKVRSEGGSPLRLGFMLQADRAEAERLAGDPAPDPWWQVRTLKIFADGIIGARTAALSGGFADGAPPGPLLIPQQALRAFVQDAHRGGWQVAAHAIGDLAIDAVLDAYRQVAGTPGTSGLPHRVEHLGVPASGTVERLRAAGACVVTQPGFIQRMADSWPRALGERAQQAFPAASLQQGGVLVAGSSDAPTGPLCPWQGIAGFVGRRSAAGAVHAPHERLPLAQALHAYTVGGAQVMGQQNWRGYLAPGQAADFAAFAIDPMTSPTEAVPGLSAVLTVVNGRAVHDPAGTWACRG
ncbi:MAG: amidohydrolase [Pararhodobacter sp.]|nr:amidohydrolase [Pararhodobacter sp.]